MKYNKTILPNGLRVITIPMKGNPTATVMVLVEAGSKYETKGVNGVSHFLEHLCFKGTTTRTGRELNAELDALGARSNAFTSFEMTGYYAKGRAEVAPKLLEIISDLYINPTLPSDEVEREKGVIIGEIDMYEDMPRAKISYLFNELVYGDQPAGWSILGPKGVIKKLDRKTILAYRSQHYVPQATTVVIAGDIAHAGVVRDVKKYFGKLKKSKKHAKKKVADMQKAPALLAQAKTTDQTHLIMGFRSVKSLHKDVPALDVLAAVLGSGMSSRLFTKLREEMGVGYYVGASHGTLTDHGMVTMAAGIDSTRLHEVILVLLAECKRLRDELVSPKELSKTKEYVLGNFEMGLESSDDLAEFYGLQEILRQPIEDPKTVEQKIRKVTAEDIRRVAKKYLTADRLNLAILGPKTDSAQLRKLLNATTSW